MVLSLLSRHPDASFTLSEICQRLDLNVSTAHSLLNALTASQFLVRQPTTKRYSLGPELVRIGAAAASRQVTLTEHAREHMGRLAEAAGRQCVASVVMAGDIVIIAKAGSTGPLGMTMDVGARLPHRPPFGTVFVAWSDEASIRSWLDETFSHSAPVMRRCLDALSAVRSHGYSVGMSISAELTEQIWRPSAITWAETDQQNRHAFEQLILNEYLVAELQADREYAIGNISAPVFGSDGRVVLALAFPYFNETLPGDVIAEHARLLVQAAGQVTREVRGEAVSGAPVGGTAVSGAPAS
jgi:DNA-binding IclR family transcriptional regulator